MTADADAGILWCILLAHSGYPFLLIAVFTVTLLSSFIA